MKKIHIEIDGNGGVKIEAKGFSGRECLDATQQIEMAIGTVEDRKKKKEFFQKSSASNNLQQRQ